MKNIKTNTVKLLSDLTTPVSLFLKVREKYPELLLLESSDYSSKEDSQSFICFEPLLTFSQTDKSYSIDDKLNHSSIELSENMAVEAIQKMISLINVENDPVSLKYNGIFGYTSFDKVQELFHC